MMTSIAETTIAVLELLNGQCPRELFPQAMFAAYQPDDFTSPMEEGVSLYLFQASRSSLSYLMTAWSPDPLRQQELLGWALEVAHGSPVLGPHGRLEILPLTITDMSAVWSMARAGAQPSVAILIASPQR